MPLPAQLPGDAVTAPVFYLHGFASSPKSTKAGFLADRLSEHGVTLRCPDFNEPDFATLTFSRMLDQLASALDGAGQPPAVLIGSSLGGALAVLAAARLTARVGRLVLFAPAVMFAKPGHHLLPPDRIEEWRRRGSLPFFHYADSVERDLRYEFYEDSLRYDPFDVSFAQPTLVFQGRQDASVDARMVEEFTRNRTNATLTLLDDDHQLIASLPIIWKGIAGFLGLGA